MAWKPVKGLEGLYSISSHGRVKSHDRKVPFGNRFRTVKGKILSPSLDGAGYLSVQLTNGSYRRRFPIHHLVASHFLPNYAEAKAEGLLIRHRDGDPHNNRVSNLVMGTQVDNMQDSRAHGESLRGSKNGQAKLSEAEIGSIRKRVADGEDRQKVGDAFSVSRKYVTKIVRHEIWKPDGYVSDAALIQGEIERRGVNMKIYKALRRCYRRLRDIDTVNTNLLDLKRVLQDLRASVDAENREHR